MIKMDNATQEQVVLAYLERLRVPVLDLLDRRHATQAKREFIQFFGSMRQSHGKFFCSSSSMVRSSGVATRALSCHTSNLPSKN
jgi:hypothetical protein